MTFKQTMTHDVDLNSWQTLVLYLSIPVLLVCFVIPALLIEGLADGFRFAKTRAEIDRMMGNT